MEAIGAGGAYRNAWRQLWPHLFVLVAAGVVFMLFSVPSSTLSNLADEAEGLTSVYLSLCAAAAYVLLNGPIGYGYAYIALKAARDDEAEIQDVVEGFRDYPNVVVAHLLVSVAVGLGLFLLIVPGVIFACKLAFTPYLVMDRKMSAWDAMQESWRMTTGHAGTVFLIGLLAVPVVLAGLIALFVGVFVSLMLVALAFASLYDSVDVSMDEADLLAV